MKNYLAVFLGKPKAMDKWRAMPEAERKQRERAGIEAWHKWVADHKDAIVEMRSPLGKTKRVDKKGVSDTRNELGAWTVVKASSQEHAAKLFLNHPHFMIFPGSPLAKKNPRWVMAAELVETSRLFARTVAKIQPEWIEPLAGHLVKRTYSEPHWSRKRAAAVAVEKVMLHGVPIVVDRRVDYDRIDPETSRDLFIRHALVEGDVRFRQQAHHLGRLLAHVLRPGMAGHVQRDAARQRLQPRRQALAGDVDDIFADVEGRGG